MLFLIVGLVLFLGVHSARIVAPGFRQRFMDNRGENAWKALYSIVSLSGFALVIFGYAQARQSPTLLWQPPGWSAHLNMLLTAVAFILVVAAYVPKNRIRAVAGHPMALGVAVWAFGHLLANGELANVVLFAAFFAWAISSFVAGRRRDRESGPQALVIGGLGSTLLTIGAGFLAWLIFAGWLHVSLIGVSPFSG